mmetsp:Transcript_6623/g.25567  ORF Transcript_6623/g.25567 Transcript_6623/m.25567 type:complete len:238 (-) Transcript_6623:397-1110(-)
MRRTRHRYRHSRQAEAARRHPRHRYARSAATKLCLQGCNTAPLAGRRRMLHAFPRGICWLLRLLRGELGFERRDSSRRAGRLLLRARDLRSAGNRRWLFGWLGGGTLCFRAGRIGFLIRRLRGRENRDPFLYDGRVHFLARVAGSCLGRLDRCRQSRPCSHCRLGRGRPSGSWSSSGSRSGSRSGSFSLLRLGLRFGGGFCRLFRLLVIARHQLPEVLAAADRLVAVFGARGCSFLL